MGGVAIDLLVRRIENRVSKSLALSAKRDLVDGVLYEVLTFYRYLNTAESLSKIRAQGWVYLVGANSHIIRTPAPNEGCREGTNASPGVQEPDLTIPPREQRGHELGDSVGRHELPQFAFPARIEVSVGFEADLVDCAHLSEADFKAAFSAGAISSSGFIEGYACCRADFMTGDLFE